MTSDLWLAVALIGALALGLFLLSAWVVRPLPARTLNLVSLLIVTCLFYYIRTLWYDVHLANWLPFSSLIVLGNWLPLLAAMLGGVVWQRTRDCVWRRGLSTVALGGTAGYALLFPMLGYVPKCQDHWDRMGNCLQTTRFTCSPACAATMLKAHGIDATEQEMAELCLTRQGTSWQGLYRGLKLKTAGTKWDVEVADCTADELFQYGNTRPMILSVGLDKSESRDGEYTREFGWIPGVNHSVILHGFTKSGCAIIADPTQELCREQWDREMLHTLWRGYAIRLVERQQVDDLSLAQR